MIHAAITGGTGFLGGALLRLLLPEADSVRALVRRDEDERRMREMGAVPIRGDLDLAGGCEGLVEEGDIVFHLASRVDMVGTWADFARTTIEGTRKVLAAALPHRPKRFVYVSTFGVYLGRSMPELISADTTPARPFRHHYYGRSKLAAEELVQAECDRAGCSWTIVRPVYIYGPGDRAVLGRLKPLLAKRQLRIIGPGTNRIAMVYVDDAARALLLCGTHAAAHRRIYDLAGDDAVTQQEGLEGIADALGERAPRRHVPGAVAMVAATAAELIAWLRRTDPPFTRAMVALMRADQAVDAGAIRRELGWRPTVNVEEGMARLREWCGVKS